MRPSAYVLSSQMLISEMEAMHSGCLAWQMLQAPPPYPIGTHVPIDANHFPLQMSAALSEGSLYTKAVCFFFSFLLKFPLSQKANILLKTWNLYYGSMGKWEEERGKIYI